MKLVKSLCESDLLSFQVIQPVLLFLLQSFWNLYKLHKNVTFPATYLEKFRQIFFPTLLDMLPLQPDCQVLLTVKKMLRCYSHKVKQNQKMSKSSTRVTFRWHHQKLLTSLNTFSWSSIYIRLVYVWAKSNYQI